VSAEIPRDRWGRPLIIPPGGGKPIGYTRVSTMAKTVDDTSNLTAWKQRLTAIGIATNPHLATRVAGVVNAHADPISDGKRDLNAIVSEACEAAGGSKAASTGTALHEMTQVLDSGDDLKFVPEQWRRHLDAYMAATDGLDVLGVEEFVVIDELTAAGSLDRLYRLPDGRVVVGDLKTGKDEPRYPLGATTQIAMYAHGCRYDPTTGERAPLHPDLDVTTGLLVHLPAARDARCDLYLLDLTAGWEVAQVAARVHAARRLRADDIARPYVRASIA